MMIHLIPASIALTLVVMLALEGRTFALGRASLHWPRVEGTILDLWFDVQRKKDSDGGEYVSTSAHLVYEYVVNDR